MPGATRPPPTLPSSVTEVVGTNILRQGQQMEVSSGEETIRTLP